MSMKRLSVSLPWGVFASVACASFVTVCPAADGDCVRYVRPEVGTVNSFEVSNGNVYPCIGRPWGMHSFSPMTKVNEKGNERWFYDYGHNKFYGLKLTHQLSPWIGDYASLSVLPITGKPAAQRTNRFSWYSHKAETISPHYYEAYLCDFDARIALAPTMRAAAFRITFGPTETPAVVIDPFAGGSVSCVGSRVVGTSASDIVAPHDSKPPRAFVEMTFDAPVTSSERLPDGALCVRFAPLPCGGVIAAQLSASFISSEQAQLNKAELGDGDLCRIAAEGQSEWNALLRRVRVSGDDTDALRMFYTCLYRMLLFPKTNWEIDAQGKVVHWSPADGKVHSGYWYSGTCFWDTFRALFPFLNLVYPETSARVLGWLENCWREYGWLPELSSPGLTDCMIGNNVASVIADAQRSGVTGDFDYAVLLEALVHETENAHPKLDAIGRKGAAQYLAKGYVPRDIDVKESAARTLEYAYDDWCVSRLASALQRNDLAETYRKRAANWRNVFDSSRLIACGRNADGSFNRAFNPMAWGGDFTEGCALHYTWSVFHDIPALATALGGTDALEKRLDALFSSPPAADWSAYGICIHEIREMQIMGFGQYAHGNQPIQHAIYLYDWTDHPEKAFYWVRQVMDRLYKPTPDGYCGDEDNGQTSAWYVWSALGMYPVCPASGELALGALRFDKAVVTLPRGATFTVARKQRLASPAARVLNGKPLRGNFLSVDDFRRGGSLTCGGK